MAHSSQDAFDGKVNMSIEKKSGVYKITNVLNGNVYVGSAVFFKRRWSLHKSELRKNHHHSPKLQNAWNKYGEDNFEFSVIEELPPVKDVLLEREQFWMDYYEAYNTHNYNVAVTAGSPMTGRKHTPERNAKMSIIMKGKQNGLGYRHTDDAKERIKEAATGRWHRPDSLEKMSSYQSNRTPEHRKRLGESRKGWNPSPEVRLRMSEAGKRRAPPSEETRRKLSENKKGWIPSEETKTKMAQAAKNRPPVSEETRAKQSASAKNRSPEHLEKLAATHRGIPLSEETKAKLSANMLGKPKSPEAIAACIESRAIKRAERLTQLPIVLAKILFLLYGMPVDNTNRVR